MELFHYTTVDTFFKMCKESLSECVQTSIKNLNLRASHVSSLDDKKEYVLYTDNLKKAVLDYGEKVFHKFEEFELKTLEQMCLSNFYLLSLTYNDDDDYMWEKYGGNYSGVSIGFDFNKIEPFYPTFNGVFLMERAYNASFKNCEYINENDIIIDNDLIKDIFYYITRSSASDNKEPEFTIKVASILARIFDNAVHLKQNTFSPEKEIRYSSSCIYLPEEIINGKVKNYKDFPIPVSSITSITLGSSIASKSLVNRIVLKTEEVFGKDTKIRYSECHKS